MSHPVTISKDQLIDDWFVVDNPQRQGPTDQTIQILAQQNIPPNTGSTNPFRRPPSITEMQDANPDIESLIPPSSPANISRIEPIQEPTGCWEFLVTKTSACCFLFWTCTEKKKVFRE